MFMKKNEMTIEDLKEVTIELSSDEQGQTKGGFIVDDVLIG